MLNQQHIERLFLAKRYPALLDAVVANGLALPLPLKVRLSRSPVAAVALGLRRLAELHHLLPPVGRDMTRWLLDRQRPSGRFAAPTASDAAADADPLPTALAVAALLRLQRDRGDTLFPFALESIATDPKVAVAMDLGVAALAAFQDGCGLFAGPDDRTWQEKAQTSALILMFLGGDPAFRGACRFADLADFFEDRAADLDSDTAALWHIARLDTPGTPAAAAATDRPRPRSSPNPRRPRKDRRVALAA